MQVHHEPADLAMVRAIADRLGCILEADVLILCQTTHEAMIRHRNAGTGPPCTLCGNVLLFPIEPFAAWLIANVNKPHPKSRFKREKSTDSKGQST